MISRDGKTGGLEEGLFLAGPTASGKSAVAMELAELLPGEIISVDSMQVYRGMDIGTAKPSLEEQARVRHHLIDVVDITESFDAARFRELASQAVREIQERKRIPIFCGGTGFYFKAWLEGLGVAPEPDPEIRAAVEKIPLAELLQELQARDPVAYEGMDRANPRRVCRAVEVLRQTGRPYSEQRTGWKKERAEPTPGLYGLRWEPAALGERITRRVEEMFQRGLVEETRRLLAAGLEKNRTALQAIGYRQAFECLTGVRSLEETRQLVNQKTRQFAKRQMTWYRHQLAPQWVEMAEGNWRKTASWIRDDYLRQRERI
jgi:tRNA dimethylallyltransferase